MDDLHYLPATEALRLFRERALSPVELMEATIARAEEVEPHVNAFGDTYFEEALAAASASERRYGGGRRPRPLEGLPVAVKEETPVAGQRTTEGSLTHDPAPAAQDAPVVERLRRAGGIVHARTTAPEFSCAGFTHSRLWGVTRNPWHLDYSPGGSSGGSAAALAAGTAALATGSDIGGSIRIPAAFCGVVGFKPPYGRVPEMPPFNLDHYCHEGPLARTVADCRLFENVLAGPHPADTASLRPKLRIPERLGGIAGWRVALSRDLGGFPVDDDVAANLEAAAGVLREAGAVVEEVDVGFRAADVTEAAHIHFGVIFGPFVAAVAERHADRMTPYALAFAERTTRVSKEDVMRGLELEGEITARLGDLLASHRLLVCPTYSVPAVAAGDDYVGRGPAVNGVEAADWMDLLMTATFNVAGRCPVMSVPSGLSRDGVPTGMSIVGRTYDDVSVFRAAAAFERLRPWLDVPARRPALPADRAPASREPVAAD
jgi:aspartyl-tRNA(Asn)/glutamyl-tRNA(Gln) amidotransferase subunit A